MNVNDTIGLVADTLKKNGITIAIIHQVVADINKAAAEEKAAKEPVAPKPKLQTVVLVREPQAGDGAKPGEQFGWVVQLDPEAPVAAVRDRIVAAAQSFNRCKAGRKQPVKSIGEALMYVKGKHWKDEARPEQKTRVITKELIQLVPINPNLG